MPPRRLLAVLALAGIVPVGCNRNAGYPPELTFPPREDRLVLKLPTTTPPRPGEIGRLDAEIAALDAAGGRTADPAALPAADRTALGGFLRETFGTPAAPRLPDDRLGLTADLLAEGSRLYRKHCVQCHGVSGDGRGPTGPWIDPHPRDFRRGAFKFVSSGDGWKPRRADLRRTLREGLRGTAMPSFALLPDDSREALAAFVVYLSVRGEVEYRTLAALADEGGEGGTDGDVTGFARARLTAILADWEKADASPLAAVQPFPDDDARQGPDYLASVARGHELFVADAGAGCAKCHENYGRSAPLRYDVWGTVVRPPDLTQQRPKGGDRAEDLAARVRHGIAPVGMPSHAALTDAQLTDVVRFVRALPYPRELPPDVRAKVFP
ncbi:MAG TPA: c-type cytochrome [Urbifossiella sp.]|nr:c-type cytochrome [Urbifossiella sp.]